MDVPTQNLTIRFNPKSVRRIIKWAIFLSILLALFLVVPELTTVVNVMVFALFFAFLLDPVVNFFENHGVDRLLAVLFVFLFLLCCGIMAFEFLSPVISHEIQEMSTGIDSEASMNVILLIQQKLGDKIPFLNNPRVQEAIKNQIETLALKSMSILVNLLSTVVSLIMVAFVTFFFLKDGRRMKKVVVSWVPNRYFEMSLIILHKTGMQLGRYLRGQLLVASIVGALSITALYLLDIRYYFFIGAMAGLANMIPYFGPLVGAIPAVIIAFLDSGGSFGAVAAVAVAFASIQLFENVFVSPFIVSKSVELHPLTIIIAILIGGQLWGIFGMLLAVPTTSIIKVTSQELYWGLRNYRIL